MLRCIFFSSMKHGNVCIFTYFWLFVCKRQCCRECGENLDRCPICREAIRSKLRLYSGWLIPTKICHCICFNSKVKHFADKFAGSIWIVLIAWFYDCLSVNKCEVLKLHIIMHVRFSLLWLIMDTTQKLRKWMGWFLAEWPTPPPT